MSPLSAACRDSIDIFCCEQEFGAVAPRQSADLIWLMLQISSSAVKKKPQWAPNYNTDAWAVQYTTLMGEWQFGDYLKMSVFVSRAQFSCQWASQSLPGQSHHWKLWWSTLAKKKKKNPWQILLSGCKAKAESSCGKCWILHKRQSKLLKSKLFKLSPKSLWWCRSQWQAWTYSNCSSGSWPFSSPLFHTAMSQSLTEQQCFPAWSQMKTVPKKVGT